MFGSERIFQDRKNAGRKLADLLARRYQNQDVLVLGVSCGGVLVAHEVAITLECELSFLVTRTLYYPPRSERTAIGTLAEDGSLHLNYHAKKLGEKTLDKAIALQEKEVKKQITKLRHGQDLPDMKGRHVILVDDGISSASTLIAAIKLCKNAQAKKVVVAVPVSGKVYVPVIRALADDVLILHQPEFFYAVGQVYKDFHHLSDNEIVSLLDGTKDNSRNMNRKRLRAQEK